MSYADGKSPFSIWIQAETKAQVDAFAEANGLRKGEMTDAALRAFMASAKVEKVEVPKAPEKPKARIGMRVRLPSASFFMSITGIVQGPPNVEIGSSGVIAHVAWFVSCTLYRDEFPIEALVPHPDET